MDNLKVILLYSLGVDFLDNFKTFKVVKARATNHSDFDVFESVDHFSIVVFMWKGWKPDNRSKKFISSGKHRHNSLRIKIDRVDWSIIFRANYLILFDLHILLDLKNSNSKYTLIKYLL